MPPLSYCSAADNFQKKDKGNENQLKVANFDDTEKYFGGCMFLRPSRGETRGTAPKQTTVLNQQSN